MRGGLSLGGTGAKDSEPIARSVGRSGRRGVEEGNAETRPARPATGQRSAQDDKIWGIFFHKVVVLLGVLGVGTGRL